MRKIYTDAEIDAALVKKWVADGGGPDDGYKIERVRELLDSVFAAVYDLRALIGNTNLINGQQVKRALCKLEGRHDRKHAGFCWTDIADACWEIVEAVEIEEKRTKRKKARTKKR